MLAIVEAEALPKVLHCLKDPDDLVRRSAATCIREVVKHTPQLATFAANAGAIAALINLIQESTGPTRVAGILALGYIGAFTETLALAVIVQKGIPPLKEALQTEQEDHAKAAAAWALGQLGRHTPDHAAAVAEADVLRLLMAMLMASGSSEDLKCKAKRASVVQICTHLEALEPLLSNAPPSILKCIVQQFAKVLPNDPKARRTFVQTGALETLLKIRETDAAADVLDSIQSVCTLYPQEVVNYYSPGYSGMKPQLLSTKLTPRLDSWLLGAVGWSSGPIHCERTPACLPGSWGVPVTPNGFARDSRPLRYVLPKRWSPNLKFLAPLFTLGNWPEMLIKHCNEVSDSKSPVILTDAKSALQGVQCINTLGIKTKF
ncbi:hypothetical protein Efla_001126 [Eimeria flavescens]